MNQVHNLQTNINDKIESRLTSASENIKKIKVFNKEI